MINKISENGKTAYGIHEFVCDSEEDVAKLPTWCTPGSTAIILNTNQDVYILSGNKKWIKLSK